MVTLTGKGKTQSIGSPANTVVGKNPAPVDTCRVLHMSGGLAGFLNHQQYVNFRKVFEERIHKDLPDLFHNVPRIISFEVLRSLAHNVYDLLSVIISSIFIHCRYMKI